MMTRRRWKPKQRTSLSILRLVWKEYPKLRGRWTDLFMVTQIFTLHISKMLTQLFIG